MRARCGIVTTVIALAACGSSSALTRPAAGTGPSAPPSVPAHCRTAGHTLAADGQARLYSAGEAVYGCAIGSHRSFRLGAVARSIREGRVGPIALAGEDAAYGYTTYGVDTIAAEVMVRGLGDGSDLHSTPATHGPLGPESVQAVDAIVVKDDGAAAWIAQSSSLISSRSHQVQVVRDDARGIAVLDSGLGIDTHSLRLRGSTLSWKNGRRTRSSALR